MTSLATMLFVYEPNHISALVQSTVEVGEVEGEEGNDVSERRSLQY